MPSAVVPNSSEVLMLQLLLNVVSQDGGAAPVGGERVLRLFSNDLEPDESTVVGDLTELSGGGYAGLTLAGASWTIGTTSDVTTALYSVQYFTFTTNTTCFGFYVTTSEVTPKLLWIDRFTDAPFVFGNTGGIAAITPKIKLS